MKSILVHSIIPQPFTYLIGWSTAKKFYYGVRYANNCHPSDLWTTYFTSSAFVARFREEFGEPDIIEVRRTFDSKLSAKLWEHRVLRRMRAATRKDFLNKNNGKSFLRNVGKPLTEEHKKSIGLRFKGKKQTADQISKRAKAWIGRKHSEESKAKMSAKQKSLPFRPHGPMSNDQKENLKKWHATNKPSLGLKRSSETIEKLKLINQGANNPNFGKKWFNNGIESKMLKVCPVGWAVGRRL